MQTTQDQLHKKNQELVDLYRDKSKKFTQITNLYNLLKSRAMRSQMQTAASDSVSRTLDSLETRNEPGTTLSDRCAGVSRSPQMRAGGHPGPHPHAGSQAQLQPPQTPLSRPYNMYPLNPDGVEQLHRHQRSGTGSSKGMKPRESTRMMPPPSRPMASGNPRNGTSPHLPTTSPAQSTLTIPVDTTGPGGHHRTRLLNPSRPSTWMTGTRMTQLPSDNVLFERFQDGPHDVGTGTPGYGGLFMAGNASANTNANVHSGTGAEVKNGGQSGLRSSLFESTIM